MQIDRPDRRRRLFILAVTVDFVSDERARPDREGVMKLLKGMYPDASAQRLEEVLWTFSSWPFGDLTLWTKELVKQKLDAQTVFDAQCTPIKPTSGEN